MVLFDGILPLGDVDNKRFPGGSFGEAGPASSMDYCRRTCPGIGG
jgi:hypothetical protein